MSKRNLLNIVLLIFILVLVALVVYKPGKEVSVVPPTLTNLKTSDIVNLKIIRYNDKSNEQELVFNKTDNGWMMVKPYLLAANSFRIDSILKILSTISYSQNNLQKLNPSTFGLNEPQATITLNNETDIVFGHNKSLKNHRYVKVGSTLHMIADTFQYQLTAKPESYVNHQVLPENSKIIKLSLPSIHFEQIDAKWKVTPEAGSTSADSINQLMSEWTLSQAYDINIVKATPKTKADVTLESDTKKIFRFQIEDTKNSFNLLNLDTGVRYVLSADRKDKLLKLSSVNQDD